jgi:hypothetical protein
VTLIEMCHVDLGRVAHVGPIRVQYLHGSPRVRLLRRFDWALETSLRMLVAVIVHLTGGAPAKNVF